MVINETSSKGQHSHSTPPLYGPRYVIPSPASAMAIEENPLFRALNPWASTFTAPVAFSCLVIVSWFFRHQHWSSCSSRCYCQSIPPLIVDCSRAASLPDVCQRNTDLGFDSTFFAVFVDSTWHISSRKFFFGRNRKYQTILYISEVLELHLHGWTWIVRYEKQ